MNHAEYNTLESSKGTKRHLAWQAWLLLLVGLFVTALATSYTKNQEDEVTAKEFNFVCNEIEGKIQDRLNAHEQILRSCAAFYEHSVYVTRQEWREFTERQKIEQQLPGIQGIGFARLIPRQKLAQHIQQIRDEGFPAYTVLPAGEREFYSSIVYLEPFKDRNLRAFGYDMLSEPVRRAAMERTRDYDVTSLTGKVILVQETNQDVQSGTLMYVPVYRKGMPRATIEQRRAALLGWVYSPYRMNDLMQGILGRWDLANNRRIRLEIFDGRQTTSNTMLYDSQPSDSQIAGSSSKLTIQRPLISSGRQWTLIFTRSATSLTEYGKVWLVLLGGILTSFLLAELSFNLYNTRYKARRLAEQLTADLQHVNTRLELATDAGGVGIWDYDVPHNTLIWDDQMFSLYGITREQFAGAYEAWTAGVHPEDRERGDREIKMALSGEKDFNTEFQVLWPDGSTHYIRAMARVLHNTAGQSIRMIGTNWDTTELNLAVKALRNSEEKFRTMINVSPDSIAMLSTNGTLVFVSEKMAAIFGYDNPEEMTGRSIYKFIDETYHEKAKSIIKEVFDGSYTGIVESLFIRKSRMRFFMEINSEILRNEQGIADKILCVGRDITKRKQAEEELRQKREQFELAVSGSQDGIWDWNMRDNSLYLSPRWKAQLGYRDDELENAFANFERLIHPEDKPGVMNYVNRYLKGEVQNYNVEYRMLHKTGIWRWILARGAAVRDEQGIAVRMAGSHTDITERKQVEHYRILSGEVLAILNESTDFQDSIQRILNAIKLAADCSAVAIRLQDGDDFPYFGQHGFSKDFLTKGNTLVALDSDGGILRGADGKPCLECTCGQVISGRTDASSPFFTRGGSFWTNSSEPILNMPAEKDLRINPRNRCFTFGYNSVALIPVREKQMIVGLLQLNDNRPDKFSLDAINALEEMASHIGEAILRKKTEAALKESEARLRELNATKDKFFSIIAHDLRGPLSSFAGMAETMADESSNLSKAEIQDFAVCIRDSATNTYSLLENLLNWATSQRGLVPFNLETVELLPIVKECMEIMQGASKNKDIEITCDVFDNITVIADRNMLQTVIRNLISNAVKFTCNGGKIAVTAKNTDNQSVEVAVIDSGIGMNSAAIDNLFRIDVRSSRNGTNGEPGTGLGLPLCKDFVEKMGGRIRVESEEDKGTKFYFTVPCRKTHGSVIEKNVPVVAGANQIKNIKILIAEDDEQSAMMIKVIVKTFCSVAFKAKTGLEAVEICRNNPDIDLILMDCAMPYMDGYEATTEIRLFNKDVIIIAQTAYALAGEREKALAAGCNDYITKPFNKTSLTAVLKKYF